MTVQARTVGLYVHIPFCATRCGYCDFNAYAGLDELRTPYVGALLGEARLWAEAWADREITSVFLGGGTPTRLEPTDIRLLFEGLRAAFDIRADAEISVEANPESIDPERIDALVASGVHRISMGAQSFDPSVLAFLERGHDPASVLRSVTALRSAGIDNLNLDLMYGTPGETGDSWLSSLHQALELEPDHISAYALTVEPPTPLGRDVASGAKPSPDPDTQADRYDTTCAVLAAAGFEHYEISNWAKPGRACAHNLTYWERRPYLGLGCGAHSFRDDRRWWNVRPPEEYLAHVAAERLPIGGEEVLDAQAIELEEVFLGLRTTAGVPGSVVPDPAHYLREGLLEARADRFVATDRGMFLANDLATEFTRAGAVA